MCGRRLGFLPLAIALAAVGLAAAVWNDAGAFVGSARAARPFVLYDAIGDAAGVPDVTSLAVARDARHRLTFALNVANHPSIERGDLLSIGIDTDRSLATGRHGVDVVLSLGWARGDKEPTYGVETWDGSTWQSKEVAAVVSYPGHGLRFTVAGRDIGVGRSFRVAGAGRLWGSQKADVVPERKLASVVLATPSTIAEMGRVTVPFTALLPEAGKILRVSGIDVEIPSDVEGIGSMVAPEKVRCSAKLGQVKLPHVGARAWRVPRTARGKTLMLKISVAYRGDEWTTVYPLRVE